METKLQTYYDALNLQVEEHLGHSVVVAGVYHHAGVVGAMVLHKVSPLLAMAMRKGAKKKAGDLPKQMVIALTPYEVLVIETRSRGRGVQLGEIAARWPRETVRVVGTSNGSIYRRLMLRVGEQTIELDGTKDETADRVEAELGRWQIVSV